MCNRKRLSRLRASEEEEEGLYLRLETRERVQGLLQSETPESLASQRGGPVSFYLAEFVYRIFLHSPGLATGTRDGPQQHLHRVIRRGARCLIP